MDWRFLQKWPQNERVGITARLPDAAFAVNIVHAPQRLTGLTDSPHCGDVLEFHYVN